MSELCLRDEAVARDIADTIISFKKDGCFKTKEETVGFISNEVRIRGTEAPIKVALLTTKIIRDASEWYFEADK